MNENRWEGIDEFVAVAECAQFTAAAESLGVSSSHISRLRKKIDPPGLTPLIRTVRGSGYVIAEPL